MVFSDTLLIGCVFHSECVIYRMCVRRYSCTSGKQRMGQQRGGDGGFIEIFDRGNEGGPEELHGCVVFASIPDLEERGRVRG